MSVRIDWQKKEQELNSDYVRDLFHSFGLPVGICSTKNTSLKENSYSSVLITYVPYYSGDSPERNISRYAELVDYHIYVRDILTPVKNKLEEKYPDGIFDIYVDNSPVDEKKAASITGLGVIGKNSLLITEKYGSYVFLGEILCDIDFESREFIPNYCSGCGKCIISCPSGAISNGKIDLTRCISAITQKKGILTENEADLIRNSPSLWGCDICQDVCPMNENVPVSDWGYPKITRLESNDICGLTNSTFKMKYRDRAFSWRGLSVIKRNIQLHESGSFSETCSTDSEKKEK